MNKHIATAGFLILLADLSGTIPISTQAYAAEDLRLEEVVVTARKRTELDQEVPIATSVFNSTTIERAGIERPQDFINLTSNVSIVDSANAGDTQVNIRGITSTRDAEGTFAFVVDGVLITNPNGFNQELFDIESIEVLKGPQGALYGRNAVSGAILITTAAPSEDFEGKLKVGAGVDGLSKLGVSLSGALGDSAAGSLSFMNRETDGQHSNIFLNKDDVVDFAKDQNIRGRIVWDVSDRLTIDTVLSSRSVESGAINFNAVFALDWAATAFADPSLFKDVNDHEFSFYSNVPGENEQENTFFSVKADYELDNALVTAIFSYDQLEEYLISDGTSAAFGLYSFDFGGAPNLSGPTVGDAQNACSASYQDLVASGQFAPGNNPPFFAFPGTVPGVAVDMGIAPFYGLNALLSPYTPSTCDGYQYQERNQDSTSFELRIASQDEAPLTWMGGMYYSQIEREVVVSYGADMGDGFFGKAPYVEGRTDQLFWDIFDTDVFAVFGMVGFEPAENHSITLTGRYDVEDRSVSNEVPNVAAAAAFGGGGPINPAYNGSFTDVIPDRSDKFTQFQPKLSWRWALNEDVSVYTSYGIGFRSGGFNNIGSAALVESAYATINTRPANLRDEYDKEVSTAFELGIKSELMDNRLRVNAAAFNTNVEDSQFFNFLAGGFGILRVVTNIDEVTLQGAEIDAKFLVNQNVSIFGSVGLIDSEIDKNINRPYTEGNEMPLTPDMTANLGAEWVGEVFSGVDLVARLDWRHVGETWFSTVQENTTLNAFTDVSATYQLIGAVWGDVTQTPAGPGIPAGGIIGFGTSDYSKGQRDAYSTVNINLSLNAENWSLTFWGDNILDETYLEEIIPAPEFGGYFIHPGKGESFGVDFFYRF